MFDKIGGELVILDHKVQGKRSPPPVNGKKESQLQDLFITTIHERFSQPIKQVLLSKQK